MSPRADPDPREYPFELATGSQFITESGAVPIVDVDPTSMARTTVHTESGPEKAADHFGGQYRSALERARWPVIAYGSNASPAAIRRKLSAEGRQLLVPLLAAKLIGFDIVYSAHISAYGSVPATICPSPGTELSTFVLLLDEEQLELVDETEPNYRRMVFGDAEALRLQRDFSAEAYVYVSRHGVLEMGTGPTALAAIPATSRRFSALTQTEALARVAEKLALEGGVEELLTSPSPQAARERTEQLRDDALPIWLPFEPGTPDLKLKPTSGAMRNSAPHHYVVAVSPALKESFSGKHAVLINDCSDGVLGLRRLAVPCRVVASYKLADDEVAADQSLRSAVGIPHASVRSLEEARVGLHSVKRHARAGRGDSRIERWLGWRYLLMRVAPAEVPDMEKQYARIPEDAFQLLGSTPGDRLLVAGSTWNRVDSIYEVDGRAIRAYAEVDGVAERRQESPSERNRDNPGEDRGTRGSFIGARYPIPETVLEVDPDLYPIYLDAGDRERLNVDVLDVVTVRPDLRHLMAREAREFGLGFFLALLGTYTLIGSAWVAIAAFFFASALALLNIRSRTGV